MLGPPLVHSWLCHCSGLILACMCIVGLSCVRGCSDTNSKFSPTDNDEPASKSSSGVDLG